MITHELLISLLSTIISPICALLTVIFTNKHSRLIVSKQLESSSQQFLCNQDFEKEKIQNERNYSNKIDIINNILTIRSEYNLTNNYIMEISKANEFYANQKYEQITKIVNQIITKLYISFPDFTEYGYKISSICNEIWGNEQNYFGYQADKKNAQNITKQKLIELYERLNKNCQNLLEILKTR